MVASVSGGLISQFAALGAGSNFVQPAAAEPKPSVFSAGTSLPTAEKDSPMPTLQSPTAHGDVFQPRLTPDAKAIANFAGALLGSQKPATKSGADQPTGAFKNAKSYAKDIFGTGLGLDQYIQQLDADQKEKDRD